MICIMYFYMSVPRMAGYHCIHIIKRRTDRQTDVKKRGGNGINGYGGKGDREMD